MAEKIKIGTDCIGVGVRAVIFNDQQELLLLKRGKQAKNEVGKWEIPGGEVAYGETFKQALLREVTEEIGVEIEVKKLHYVWNHILPDENQHWIAPTYICHIVQGNPSIQEPHKHDEMGWFGLEQALELPLSKITKKDVKRLLEHDIKTP